MIQVTRKKLVKYMTKSQLIEKYENMMYKNGFYDVFDDDIKPKLKSMTYKQILHNYKLDKQWYTIDIHTMTN